MNRVIVGIITLVIFVGIVFLAFRTVNNVRTRLLARQSPGASSANETSPLPGFSPTPSSVVDNSDRLGATTTNPSPAGFMPKTGGQLPATGL